MLNQSLLEESLAVLGESLAERGVTFEIVAVGGGSLLLLGLISRPTADLDVVAFIEFLKLYAAVDQGPSSKHFQDLVALSPSRDELLDAARWAMTHDPSPGFRSELLKGMAGLGVEDADRQL